jgi:hypothetical protein
MIIASAGVRPRSPSSHGHGLWPRACAASQPDADRAPSLGAPKALFQMMGVFAEFKRHDPRAGEGGARAREGSRQDSWKAFDRCAKAIRADLRAGGVGIIKLAKLHGVGVGTVQRIKAALMANHAPGLRP